MKILKNSCSLSEVESRLTKYTYLSRSDLPGYTDGVIFNFLVTSKRRPDQACSPSFYHWFILMSQFAPSTIARWVQNKKLYDKEDSIISHFIDYYQNLQQNQRTPLKPIRNSDFISCGNIPHSTLLAEKLETDYIITVLLKSVNVDSLQVLKRKLSCYDVAMMVEDLTGEITINCRASSCKRQEIANVIGASVQFENILVKRGKVRMPSKMSLR